MKKYIWEQFFVIEDFCRSDLRPSFCF